MQFSFGTIQSTEFGVGRDHPDGQQFHNITVDGSVQDALQEMATATWDKMQGITATPAQYEPAEKHGSMEHLVLPLADDLAMLLRDLQNAQNLALDNAALSDPTKVFCYFAKMTDADGRTLIALRRASQFKGILKNRLIRVVTDALKIIEDNVFKLDHDYDFLFDAENVHILRPSGFEFVCKLQQAVLDAVPNNIQAIETDLDAVDFTNIATYASSHPRAARYLASIRTQEIAGIDTPALKRLCRNTGVEFRSVNGKIIVEDGHVMGLLEVLDRRRYEVKLVANTPERFRAASRSKLEG